MMDNNQRVTFICRANGKANIESKNTYIDPSYYSVKIDMTPVFWNILNLELQENSLNYKMSSPSFVYGLIFDNFDVKQAPYRPPNLLKLMEKIIPILQRFWWSDIERYYTKKGEMEHINKIVSYIIPNTPFQICHSLRMAVDNTNTDVFQNALNTYTYIKEF